MKHYNLKIFGRVQGVGFRFMAMEAAYKYQIMGYVKNVKDGSVYLEAEGMEDNLRRFLEWCQSGVLRARVERIEVEEGVLKDYKSFDIQRSSTSLFEKYL